MYPVLEVSYPLRSLKSIHPRENQSALLSYAVPFCSTSGAMYPWVPLKCQGDKHRKCQYVFNYLLYLNIEHKLMYDMLLTKQ